jgi:hypothetical protein
VVAEFGQASCLRARRGRCIGAEVARHESFETLDGASSKRACTPEYVDSSG